MMGDRSGLPYGFPPSMCFKKKTVNRACSSSELIHSQGHPPLHSTPLLNRSYAFP